MEQKDTFPKSMGEPKNNLAQEDARKRLLLSINDLAKSKVANWKTSGNLHACWALEHRNKSHKNSYFQFLRNSGGVSYGGKSGIYEGVDRISH